MSAPKPGDHVRLKENSPLYRSGARDATVASVSETLGGLLRRKEQEFGLSRRQLQRVMPVPPGYLGRRIPVLRLAHCPTRPPELPDGFEIACKAQSLEAADAPPAP